MNYGAKGFQELDLSERFIQDMQMVFFFVIHNYFDIINISE